MIGVHEMRNILCGTLVALTIHSFNTVSWPSWAKNRYYSYDLYDHKFFFQNLQGPADRRIHQDALLEHVHVVLMRNSIFEKKAYLFLQQSTKILFCKTLRPARPQKLTLLGGA